MKKTFVMAICFFIPLITFYGATLYVTARICPLFSDAVTSADRLGILRQGDTVTLVTDKGDWVLVQASIGKGYIQKIFTSTTAPVERKSSADMVQDMSSVTNRKRASYYTSSAAATRGFSTENVRDRENVAFKNYDFDAIKWLEKFSYTDEDLVKFAQKEGFGF